MTIEVIVGNPALRPPSTLSAPKKPQVSLELNVRRTLAGELLIRDHSEIDIVIIPASNKILALSKDSMSDSVYEAQTRLFDYLRDKGIIYPDSIQGGNVYASLEGTFPILEDGKDPVEAALLTIGRFMENELPYYEWESAYEDYNDEQLVDPPASETTPLGEVPEEDFKGSIPAAGYPGRYLRTVAESKK
jgi:hypothetical protein